MSDDFTETYAFLSPDATQNSFPRAPRSVEKTVNLLALADVLDRKNGLGTQTHSAVPKTPNCLAPNESGQKSLNLRSVPRIPLSEVRQADFTPRFLNHSTPVLNGNEQKLPKDSPRGKGRTHRRTVSISGSPSSDAEEGVFSGWYSDPAQTQLRDLLNGLSPSMRKGCVAHLQLSAREYLRKFNSENRLGGVLDLDLTRDHTFDQQEAPAVSPETTPPSSSGSGPFLQTSFYSSRNCGSKPTNSPIDEPLLLQKTIIQEAENERNSHSGFDINERSELLFDSISRAFVSYSEAQEQKLLEQELRIKVLEERMENLTSVHQALKERLGSVQPALSENLSTSIAPITKDSLPDILKPYYQKLQLAKVDQCSEIECRNLLKGIMLSLLISDFDRLPTRVRQLGLYINLSAKFLDTLHNSLYGHTAVTPLDYLFEENLDANDGLEECLAGMTSLVLPILRRQMQ